MSDPTTEGPRLKAAADWFTRLGSRRISTQSLRAFRDWREDPANDAAYQAVERTWSGARALAADPQVLKETEALLARRRSRPAWTAPAALAGALAFGLVALGAGALFLGFSPAATYATAVGEQRLVRLADGSRLHVNTDSRVRVAFSRSERRITLARGQAFFDVAHDPQRPFVVAAGGARVRALGTKFEVRREAADVRVTLLEGSVRVAYEDRPTAWTLAPNQQLVLAGGRAAARPADAGQATSWTTGRLMFRSTPLAAAVAEVNRYSESKVRLAAPGLEARPVSGVFDVGDTDSFVRAVEELFDLEAQTGAAGTTLAPRGAT